MDHYTVLHFGPGDIVIVAAAQQVQNVCAPHIELSPCPDRKTDFYYIGTFKIKVDSTWSQGRTWLVIK
jgi:hypothetical protein